MKKIADWLNSGSAPVVVDILRIAGGAFLVYKGVIFALDIENFQAEVQSVGWNLIAAHAAIAIAFVHTVCGSLLAFGAASKWMALLNLPIIAGAVLFNYEKLSVSNNWLELEITIGLLMVLLIVIFTGSGKVSFDQIRRNRGERGSI